MEERKVVVADPTPLGLLGLAIVTLVASSQKLGLTSGVSYLIPWAIFLGASAQLYASINDAKKNNTFGATAFGGYAFFWYGMAMSWMIGNGVFGETLMKNTDSKQLGVMFVGYLIFTLYMTVGSMATNKVLFIIFVLIDFLFYRSVLFYFWHCPWFLPRSCGLVRAVYCTDEFLWFRCYHHQRPVWERSLTTW